MSNVLCLDLSQGRSPTCIVLVFHSSVRVSRAIAAGVVVVGSKAAMLLKSAGGASTLIKAAGVVTAGGTSASKLEISSSAV